MFITDFPFDWIRRLTILPCQPTEYDKYYTIAWPYCGIMVCQMIVTKSWPIHWGFWCYLPVAVAWSIMFYFIQGTKDYPKDFEHDKDDEEEEEAEAESPAKPVTGLAVFGKLASKDGEANDKAADGEKDVKESTGEKEEEKAERNKVPGSWYMFIAIVGMI